MKVDLSLQQAVQIAVLDAGSDTITGRVVSSAGHYITLLCDGMVPADAIVRVTWPNCLILGEVFGFLENKQTVVVHIRHAVVLADIDEIRSRWV